MPKKPSKEDLDRGHRIRDLRRAQGLTQTALATACGVDKSTVGRWESGELSPRDNIKTLARVLRSTPAQIIFGSEPLDAPASEKAWDDFEAWLDTAPEKALAKPWMLDTLRGFRFVASEPTAETYKRMLFGLLAARPKKE